MVPVHSARANAGLRVSEWAPAGSEAPPPREASTLAPCGDYGSKVNPLGTL